MINVPVREELFEPIRKMAEQGRTSVESLVNDWLARQLAVAREQKIREEAARFRARFAELSAQHAGEYVAMRNGEILDHSPDIRELYLRIKKGYGDEAILITPVMKQPIPVYRMRSPRLIGPAL